MSANEIFLNIRRAAFFFRILSFRRAISSRSNWISGLAFSSVLLCAALSAPLHAADKQPITDDIFLREAFVSARTEIILSKIALEKSRNSGVKKIAKVIIADNSAANDQLRVLAAARKLGVPILLDKDDQQQIEQLKNSDKESLDTTYRGNIQRTHDIAMELFDRIAKNPRADAEFRVFATQRLTLYKKHSQMIAKLNLTPGKAPQQRADKTIQQQASR